MGKTDESEGHYGLDAERKKTVEEMKMPTSTKQMQRFLGTALFFSEFIPCYADATRLLYDMTKTHFVWDPGTWTEDYEGAFRHVKQCLCESVEKYFPDYELNWILRVDASDSAVGAVLLQIKIIDGKEVYQPIGFKSHKFSGSAANWDAHKKEAYALYFGVKSFSYYLRGKPFILETDHSNLQYIEKSEVPIIVRWRVYLQSFMHVLRHIKGKHNTVADWASRLYRILCARVDRHELDTDETVFSLRADLALYMMSASASEAQEDKTGDIKEAMDDLDLPEVYRVFLKELEDDVEVTPVVLPWTDEPMSSTLAMLPPLRRSARIQERDMEEAAGTAGATVVGAEPIDSEQRSERRVRFQMSEGTQGSMQEVLPQQFSTLESAQVKDSAVGVNAGAQSSECGSGTREQGTQTADDTDIVVPEGAEVRNIPMPEDGTRWAGGDWFVSDNYCRPCGEPVHPAIYIRFVHNAGAQHFAARRTYRRLKHFFPGSKIPYRTVVDFVANCPRCQANPEQWTRDINPIVRTLIPKDFRTRIGIDTMKITPRDKNGNNVLVVIVNLKTKLVFLYPAKEDNSSTVATAIIQFITTYGLVDEIVSDPGSSVNSRMVNEVIAWLGLRHYVSLVDVHESNGSGYMVYGLRIRLVLPSAGKVKASG